jgi:hypothetical protein
MRIKLTLEYQTIKKEWNKLFHSLNSDSLFENVMAPAAGYADFAAALGSTKALLAAWTLEVSEILTVTLPVCTDFVSDKGAVPVVFGLALGQVLREGTEVGIDDNQHTQSAENVCLPGKDNVCENQNQSKGA